MENWYVVKVFTGKEEAMKAMCLKMISPGLLKKCFIPYREQMKRYEGAWHKERRILFPGYLFVITEEIKELAAELNKITGFTKVLGDKDFLMPLSDAEVNLLKRLGGDEQIVEMSIGVIEHDKIIINEGPMQGLEGFIRKIDRRKRLARIEIEMFGQVVEAQVGVEIVSKVV